MGKKKVSAQSNEEVLKEKETVDSAVSKATPSKKSRRVEQGRVYIKTSFNNTLVTITDASGNVMAWVSAGSMGFSGPTEVEVIVSGVGGGRDSAIRSLINHGFNILSIRDATPIPHNGPRPRKPRRV